jgi:hypothetical protein
MHNYKYTRFFNLYNKFYVMIITAMNFVVIKSFIFRTNYNFNILNYKYRFIICIYIYIYIYIYICICIYIYIYIFTHTLMKSRM